MIHPLLQRYRDFLGNPCSRYAIPLAHGNKLLLYEYPAQPCEGATTIVSLGLSECPVHLPQEILFCTYNQFLSDEVFKLLGAVALQAIDSTIKFSRGDILGPAGPLLSTTQMEAFYVTLPTYFDPSLAQVVTGQTAISVYWLIPIYKSEVSIVSSRGWDLFETLLEEHDPDLLDLSRPPIG